MFAIRHWLPTHRQKIGEADSATTPDVAENLEQELLRFYARQARRVPIPVLSAAAVIAALTFGRVPLYLTASWFGLVASVSAIRWIILDRLPTWTRIAEAKRLRIVVALSLLGGMVHGLSLAFFPFLPDLARAVQTIILFALCAGAVTTLAGYLPVVLAYVLPIFVPLAVLWALEPGTGDSGWVEGSMAVWVALSGIFCVTYANGACRVFRESFAIRLRQVELNRQLQAALEQAEAASRAKTRFLASASHDLRQPIHTVSLFGAALSMRPLDAQSREVVQHMNAALRVLASQLDALLDISKLDARVVRVEPAQIKLRDMLTRLYREFEPTARAKEVMLTLVCPENGFIETDQLLFERIVRNLLDNAVKYTDRGHIDVHVERNDTDIIITIEDSGRGIPESEQTRVFEEFYQLDNPERDRTRGLGLGLPIVRRLTELLKIDLDMDSAPGRGTRFSLRLPAVEPAPRAIAPAAPEHETPSALHILVVDDEAEVRLGMKTLLEGMDCRVTLADGTAQALDQARTCKPDIVFSDLRLRGEDSGIETVRAIRALYPAMPALFISGDIAPARLREAEAAGIPLLHKPVPVDVLKQAIGKAIS